MRNNERYSAFSPAVSQAFLEVSDLRAQFISVYLDINGKFWDANLGTRRQGPDILEFHLGSRPR
jgi:hypothetical protein